MSILEKTGICEKALEEKKQELEEREKKLVQKEQQLERRETENLVERTLLNHSIPTSEECITEYIAMVAENALCKAETERKQYIESCVTGFKNLVERRAEEEYNRLVQFALSIAKTMKM